VVRIDLGALLRDVVRLDEVTAETLTLGLARSADGRGNWDAVFRAKRNGGKTIFAGIDRLRFATVDVNYRGAGGDPAARWEVNRFEGALAADRPATARGSIRAAGQTLDFELRSAPLGQLVMRGKPIPVQAEIRSSFARLKVDGAYSPPDAVFDATCDFSAPDADAVFSALGIASRKAGALDSRGRVRVTGNAGSIKELDVRLGESRITGSWGLEWGGRRPRLSADLTASLLDQRPFDQPHDASKVGTALESLVAGLDQVATGMDLDARVSVAEFRLTGPEFHDIRIEARSAGGLLSATAQAAMWGVRAKALLAYDARKTEKTLTGRVEGARVSTAQIPKDQMKSTIAATIADLRGQFRGQGASARNVAASIRGRLEARDLRLRWLRAAGQPVNAHLASASLEVGGGKPLIAEIRGQLGGQSCTVRGSGGRLEALIAGEPWPAQLDATCPGTRLAAKGRVSRKGAGLMAEGSFSGRSGNMSSILAVLGVRSTASFPAAAQGQVQLDEDAARVKLDQVAVGRTAGSGQLLWHFRGKALRQKISLTLKSADFDELVALAPTSGAGKQADAMAREVLPANLTIPDVDFELTAATARIAGETLRKLRIVAAPMGGALPPAQIAFDWNGGAIGGELSADFRGARPGVEIKATAQQIDLSAVPARAGYREAGLSADRVTLQASASGVRLGELLTSAAVQAALVGGRIKNVQRFSPGLTGDAEFSATFAMVPGRPATLAVLGKAAGAPFDISLEAERLLELARPGGGVPVTLKASLGETNLEASGKIAPDSTGEIRARVAGERLDRLGKLAGVPLPAVGPYSAAASLVVAPDSIRVSDLDVQFGKSRVLGVIHARRGGARPEYRVELRAPVLHLEDLGLDVLIRREERPGSAEAVQPGRPAGEPAFARLQRVLRGFDGKAALEIESVYSAGSRYGGVRLGAALKGGNLHVTVRDAQLRGGSANADVRFEAGRARPRLRLRFLAEAFDVGHIVKALNPKSALGGTLDLSFELVSEALSPPLFADAQGRFEVAIYPRNLQLGAADHWGTGLLQFIQRSLDPGAESSLNCAVAIVNVGNGVARSEAFFADTTRVRVIGDLELEIASRRLSGQLSPRAKNPQLFSVAPTIALSGTAEEPKVGIMPQTLITAPLRLALPIHTFALDWLTQAGAGAEGAAGCRQAFERARRR
jgi:uncharacterized protein involved in outer membrane biogenesis